MLCVSESNVKQYSKLLCVDMDGRLFVVFVRRFVAADTVKCV